MTRRRLLISAAILTIPTALGGCALPIAASVASYAFDAFSYAVEGKSVGDLAISNVMGEDCSMLRVVAGEAVCHDYSPEDQRARDRFVAEAKTFDRHANSVGEPTGSYEPADRSDPSSVALIAANGRADDSAAMTVDTGTERAVAAPGPSDARVALPAPAENIPVDKVPGSERTEFAADWTTGNSKAVAILTTGESQGSAILPPSTRALPAAVISPAVASQTKPMQVASATGIDAIPKPNSPERLSLAPRLGLDLDTMLLTESAD